jgi:hypothetical protein
MFEHTFYSFLYSYRIGTDRAPLKRTPDRQNPQPPKIKSSQNVYLAPRIMPVSLVKPLAIVIIKVSARLMSSPSPIFTKGVEEKPDEHLAQQETSNSWFPNWEWGFIDAHSACSTRCPAKRARLSLGKAECQVEGCHSFHVFQVIVQESRNHLQQCLRKLAPQSDISLHIEELVRRQSSYRLYEISKIAISMLMLDLLLGTNKGSANAIIVSELKALAMLVDAVTKHASSSNMGPREAYITLENTHIERRFSAGLYGLTVSVAEYQSRCSQLQDHQPGRSKQLTICLDIFLKLLHPDMANREQNLESRNSI